METIELDELAECNYCGNPVWQMVDVGDERMCEKCAVDDADKLHGIRKRLKGILGIVLDGRDSQWIKGCEFIKLQISALMDDFYPKPKFTEWVVCDRSGLEEVFWFHIKGHKRNVADYIYASGKAFVEGYDPAAVTEARENEGCKIPFRRLPK